MQSIFEFIDYRKYLDIYYKEQKEKTHFFSYRYFSQRAEIASPSFLKHVIDGKRNLTRPVIEKFRFDQVNEALDHLRSGKAKYRIVLER